MTTEPARRAFLLGGLGGMAGAVAGVAWTLLGVAVLRVVDDAGSPLPSSLDLAARLVVGVAVWLPWALLFTRVGFRWWWSVPAAAWLPFAGIALAGVTGVRLATGGVVSRRART